MTRRATPRHQCIACGRTHDQTAMHPFGRHAGVVVAWACKQCLDAAPSPAQQPDEQLTAAIMEVIA